jgi:alpha-amylase
MSTRTTPTGAPWPSRRGRPLLALSLTLALAACGSSGTPSPPPYQAGQPVTVNVTGYFPPGATIHDAYSGANVLVSAGGTVTVTPASEGLALLEPQDAPVAPFLWKNATVYYAITDRYADGNVLNNNSYGRPSSTAADVGGWRGGDWAGLKAKLPYLQGLGVDALWISPVVEQVHGWVGGGGGSFKHFAYAGYWALDFTMLDQNFGTEAELKALIDEAHAQGIRVLVDVVLNHPGYATGDDLVHYLPSVFKDGTGATFTTWSPGSGQTWDNWNDLVNYSSGTEWAHWWSPNWIRAGFGYPFQTGGTTPETQQLTFLPDFKTEDPGIAGVPDLFSPTWAHQKTPTNVTEIPNGTVRDYLVKWHTDWVRKLGIDGFRCDTALNVEKASWAALKVAGTNALADWKLANPSLAANTGDFWMTGEVYGHGVGKDGYYTAGGFDSLINFDFQPFIRDHVLTAPGTTLAAGADTIDPVFKGYADAMASDPGFDALTYLSSHDTRLFFAVLANDPVRQRQALTALLLVPGGAQLFYGDESGRQLGPDGGDPAQGTRSFMNWGQEDASIQAHVTKVATFRKRHQAIGAGTHARIASPAGTWAFGRKLASDSAVVVITAPR